METVDDHYAKHLGPIYAWMVGGVDAALERGAAELDALPLPSTASAARRRVAVDLGAGFGMHSLPLARRGWKVIALDSCRRLLDEIQARKGILALEVIEGDLEDFPRHAPASVDLILCMGDTLTHLAARSAVEGLLRAAAGALAPGGAFVATFRNYMRPLEGDARFIPVRSDTDRILTCFLEYSQDTVTVHDLLHSREGGAWRLRASSYPKLRLDPAWVAEQLTSRGLAVSRDAAASGMARIVARAP